MQVGDLVRYTGDTSCIGSIIAIGATMYKVHWSYHGVVEWMPPYALELVNGSR